MYLRDYFVFIPEVQALPWRKYPLSHTNCIEKWVILFGDPLYKHFCKRQSSVLYMVQDDMIFVDFQIRTVKQ